MIQTDKIMANVFQLLGWRLGYINQDMKVTAENVENLKTPGYKQKELPSFSESLSRPSLALWRTNPAHLSVNASDSANTLKPRLSTEEEKDFSGNNVNFQTQLMRANQSNLAHTQMTNLYRVGSEIIELALLNNK